MLNRYSRVLLSLTVLAVSALLLAKGIADDTTKKSSRSSTSSSKTKAATATKHDETASTEKSDKVVKTPAEWRKILTAKQFEVARRKGTEDAFTGAYWNNHKDGVYRCVCCGEPLFDSKAKFDSGTGWPSYWQAISEEVIETKEDHSHGVSRIEVVCKKCDGHLGHVFGDGPAPTGLRYCINSASLKFVERKADEKKTDEKKADEKKADDKKTAENKKAE